MDGTKVIGVGAGLDLTLDEEQNYLKSKGLPWERAKSFRGSAVLTRFVPYNGKLEALELKLYKNGKLQQHAQPVKMIYGFDEIIEQCDAAFGIDRCDVIMTGTPEGVDSFNVGDRFDIMLYEHDQLIIEEVWEVE